MNLTQRRPTDIMLTVASKNGAPAPDPEVKPKKATRRRFSAQYKLRILAQTDAMLPGELGAFLRREGIYSSSLSSWRKQRESGQLVGLEPKKRGVKAKTPEAKRLAELEADNARLQRRLDQAELVIGVQKKLWCAGRPVRNDR